MTDERSPIWGTAAWSAMAGGAGYGFFRARAELADAFRTGNVDVAAQTARQMNLFGGFDVGRRAPGVAPTSGMSFNLSSLVASSSLDTVKTDIASAAYEAVLAGGRTSHEDAINLYKRIIGGGNIDEAYQEAAAGVNSLGGMSDIFTNRVEGLGSFYSDADRLGRAGISPGGFSGPGAMRQAVTFGQLDKAVQSRAADIKGRLFEASKGEIKWESFYDIKDMIGGKEVSTPMMRGRIGNELIDIPLADTGLTYGGKNLTSRYITRGAYTQDKSEIMNYTDRFVSRLEETFANQKNKTGMKHAVNSLNNELIDRLRTESAASRAQAVWSMPDAVLPAGGRVRGRLNLEQAVYAGAGQVDENLRNEIITEALSGGRQLYPIGSPDVVAKGTMMTSNVTTDLYGNIGYLADVGRRPTQFIRDQFGVTEEAKRTAQGFHGMFGDQFSRVDRKIKGARWDELVHGGEDALSGKAYSSPQLMTFYAKPDALETGALGRKMFNEEMLIARDAADMLEYERVVQKQITLEEGFRVNEDLMTALKGKRMGEVTMLENPINNGQFLGIERATGRELFSGAQRAEAEIIGAELIDKNTANVYQREVRRMGRKDYWKFFSEDVKFLGRTANEKELNQMLRLAGAPLSNAWGERNMIAGQAVEAMAGGQVLKKNRMALMTQQIEALGAIAADIAEDDVYAPVTALGRSRRKERMARAFMANPERYLGVGDITPDNIAGGERAVQERMVRFAKKMGFSKEQMGMTFGLMDTDVAKSLGIADAVSESTGVIGLSKMRLGDLPYEGGAGGLASMEQTGFRMLAMKGEEGQRMAAELTTRLQSKGDLMAADRMMSSMIGSESLTDKARVFVGKVPTDPRMLANISPDNLIQEQGRYVELGMKLDAFGGSSRIYVPGSQEASNLLLPTITDKGNRIESQVVRNLQELQGLMSRGAGKEELELSAARLRTQVVQAAETQAAARGKVIGSRFLTGIRQTDEITDNTFRISQRTAESMMDDLIDKANTDDQIAFLKEQKRLLLEKQESVIGGMWRHPTTGPESFQFVKYKVDKNLADELISAPRMMQEIEIDGVKRTVDVSHMVGFKGDFDKDQFALAAISDRETAKRAERGMKAGVNRGYSQYLFNHYAMKDMLDQTKGRTATQLNASYAEAMKAGARNLTTAKVATGDVNIALQKLKLGLAHTAPEKYRPMAELFFHLEEAAIGGKHGAYQGAMYQDIADAVRLRDSSKMESVLKQLMGSRDRMISGGIAGENQKFQLKYSPAEYAEQAISSAVAAGDDVDYAYKAARAAKGNVSEDLTELMTMYYKRRTGSLDVAQSMMQAKDYGMEGFESFVNRGLRRAQTKRVTIGAALGKAKAPIAAGVAAAGAIMLASPSISGSIAKSEGSNAGRRLTPNDLGPPPGQGMTPPDPRIMTSPKAYDMTGIETASRAKIRMSMSDADASSDDFMRQSSVLSSNSNVRIRTTDDRSALNPQRLASKIHERL